jgi:hypothetical protein
VKSLEEIYNIFLKTSRSENNLPYKARKDFSKIQNEEYYPTLLKLENFFKRNPYVNLKDFFEAPYKVYEDEKHFNLDFYITQKAIKIYTLYQKKKVNSDPDSEFQKKIVSDGLVFIYEYCKNNNLDLNEYFNHKSGNLNTVFLHLKEKNISIYNCLAFEKFQEILNQNNFEFLDFMLGDIISKISIFRTKFYSSKTCKKICIEGLKIVKEKLAKIKK